MIAVCRMLGFKVRVFFSELKADFEWLSLSSWRGVPANSLPVGLITGRVFDRQVYMRLTLTVRACYIAIIQWGFLGLLCYCSHSLRVWGPTSPHFSYVLLHLLCFFYFVLLPQRFANICSLCLKIKPNLVGGEGCQNTLL